LQDNSVVGAAGARQKRPKWWQGLLLVLLGAMAAWSGLWSFAAHQTSQVLDAWLAREKTFGRLWSCPDRRIEGYPFGIAIACGTPHFAGLIFGQDYAGTLQGFRASAVLAHPRDVAIEVVAPFVATSKDGKVNFQITWDKLAVQLDGLPQDLWQVAVNGQNFVLRGSAGTVGIAGRVTAATAKIVQRADADPTDGQALDFDIALTGTALPMIDHVLGPGTPSDISAQGTATQTAFDPRLTAAQNLDRWRLAGGRVNLAAFAITRGDTKFAAKGTFALNLAHRVDGRFDTRSSGFEPVLQHYGIDPGLISFGALLGNLLSGGSGQPQQETALHLPVRIEDGAVAVGPIRTSIRIPPAY
jgi:hypothetical protein